MIQLVLTKHKRIVSKKTIKECRKQYCEHCNARTNIEPHHIYTVGSGGGDIKENLIQLCTDCHIAAHNGKLIKDTCLDIIARREGLSREEIHKINRRAMGYNVC